MIPSAAEDASQLSLSFEHMAGTTRPRVKPSTTKTGHAGTPAAGTGRRNGRPSASAGGSRAKARAASPATAEQLAAHQREISVSEFFAKNRHLLGFENNRKSLLTAVKEAVDNSLDACEEAGVLPEIRVELAQLAEDRFRILVHDNGPGIVKEQIPNIFGKLLYGSKFHRLRMARGQQGIGISAAGMYGLITTGRPISVISRTGPRKDAHHYKLAIDTKKNRPDIVHDDTVAVEWEHGTQVELELVGAYTKGRQSVDEYIEQTAIVNPHARIVYHPPTGDVVEYPRGTVKLPDQPREIKPHPYGIELGTLIKMLKDTPHRQIGAFLQHEFSRVSSAVARKVCEQIAITAQTWVRQVDTATCERLYKALQSARIMAPATDCLAPIGAQQILAGLLKGLKAEFYTAATRSPAVYRGNPFQVEVGVAFGGELPADEPARVIRFANRVPLLYQQSHCVIFKSVVDNNWRAYGVQQSQGAAPAGPLVIMVHFASVWVPFTSESKEAIADYDEVRKEITLGLRDCGRRLATYIRRRQHTKREGERRSIFQRYIGEVVSAVGALTGCDQDRLRKELTVLALERTALADRELDEHGRLIKRKKAAEDDYGDDTVVVERGRAGPGADALFEEKERAAIRERASSAGGSGRSKRGRQRKRS